jgi:hypothetical protein
VVVVAVTGMRGMGKTQLAAACARARLGQPGSRLVEWIDAETAAGLAGGLAETAEALGSPGGDSRAVRHWLEADGSGCLLVLDNLADPEAVQPFLPDGGSARVVITSTRREAAGLGTAVDVARSLMTPWLFLAILSNSSLKDDAEAAAASPPCLVMLAGLCGPVVSRT